MRSAPELRYANLFWAFPNKRVYAAQGYHGQYVIVMPALDIVVVITGTQDRSLEKWVDYLTDCVKSDAPLLANPAAVALLSSRVEDAATEKPFPVRDVPPIAKVISGKVYYFADNNFQLNSISLNLSDPNPSYEYQVKMGRSTAPLGRFAGPIGVNGVFRLGPPTSDGISAAKGAWIDEKTFVLQTQTLGNDNAHRVVLTFEGMSVDLNIDGADGFITLLHGETKG
jgi:hypothetical protein